jgi:hypothetical protein
MALKLIIYHPGLMGKPEKLLPLLLHEVCHVTGPALARPYISPTYNTDNPIESYKLLVETLKTTSVEVSLEKKKTTAIARCYPTLEAAVNLLHEELATSLAATIIFEIYQLKDSYINQEQLSLDGHLESGRYLSKDIVTQALKQVDYNQVRKDAQAIINFLIPRLETCFNESIFN